VKPWATMRQNPMDGMYRTRSATTNPTGKNRLEAGRKGSTRNPRPWGHREGGEGVAIKRGGEGKFAH